MPYSPECGLCTAVFWHMLCFLPGSCKQLHCSILGTVPPYSSISAMRCCVLLLLQAALCLHNNMLPTTVSCRAALSCCSLPHRYRMDYLKFVEHHRATEADITIGCLPVDYERASDFGLMKIDDEGRILVSWGLLHLASRGAGRQRASWACAVAEGGALPTHAGMHWQSEVLPALMLRESGWVRCSCEAPQPA